MTVEYGRYSSVSLIVIAMLSVTACASERARLAVPLPPDMIMTAEATNGGDVSVPRAAVARNVPSVKSCSFSSFQRKNTVGYEFSESTHLALTVSPSFDIWDASDFDVKSTLRFTHALGGSANKRPCTFGSGYYGLVPYIANNPSIVGTITDPGSIKTMLREQAEDRRRKQKEREERL